MFRVANVLFGSDVVVVEVVDGSLDCALFAEDIMPSVLESRRLVRYKLLMIPQCM